MSILVITTGIVSLLFFMAGCLEMAFYIGHIGEGQSVSDYLPGLLIAAWPLGIAALLFILLDIRLNLPTGDDRDESYTPIPEAPPASARHTGVSATAVEQAAYTRHTPAPEPPPVEKPVAPPRPPAAPPEYAAAQQPQQATTMMMPPDLRQKASAPPRPPIPPPPAAPPEYAAAQQPQQATTVMLPSDSRQRAAAPPDGKQPDTPDSLSYFKL